MKKMVGNGWLVLLMILALGHRAAAGGDTGAGLTGKIAVANFDVFLIENKEIGQAIASMISSELAGSGKFQMIERAQLERLLEEQRLSLSGIILPEQAIEAGKMAGVDRMLIGSVGKLGVVITLNARAIDPQTGMITGGWSLNGQEEGDLPRLARELVARITGAPAPATETAPAPNAAVIRPTATESGGKCPGAGFWASEWYDGKGKHAGSIYTKQNGNSITGWTVEDIGPARLEAAMNGNSMQGTYTAGYGNGNFEFTLSDDCQRLIGTYGAAHGAHGTWMAWLRPQPPAPPRINSRVFADWSGDFWSYPGTIKQINNANGKYFIQYDDGDAEWLPPERVYDMDLKPGDVVYIAQSRQSNYIYATVLELKEGRIYVEYKTGKKKWEPIDGVRLLRVRQSGY